MSQLLDTVVTIPVVVFDHEQQIDSDATSEVSERMLRGGITVLTVNGNTGEYYSLSSEERKTAVRLSTQFADRAEVVAGIGLDLSTALEDGKYALQQGCEHLMVHHPPHPFVSPEGWLHYNREIASAFPDLNVIPYVKSPNIPAETVLRLIDSCKNIGAVKYAVEDPTAYGRLVASSSREITWICGVAEKWAPAFSSTTGLAAFTSGLANVSPKLSLDLYQALKINDIDTVTRLWMLALPFEELRSEYASKNNVSVVKEALAQLALAPATVRAPISSVDVETAEKVATSLRNLKSAGYLAGER